ncbi:MAG TPA: type II toxin-antitoxin system RelE/ParE family toxin, partial [Pseudorhizobium sp.]|nr:type II toxin-antitoxin system RelE/ParE family toxin [Pseudorhizobium sp.]
MSYTIRYTQQALDDIDRLYDYLVAYDIELAERAYQAMQKAIASLAIFPFSHRKAAGDDPFLREILVLFGSSGYVVLYRVQSDGILTVAALRH